MQTHNTEEGHVPPSRCFFVLPHELHVNIWLLSRAVPVLSPDSLAIVKVSIYDERGYSCK